MQINLFFTIGNNSFPFSRDVFGQVSRLISFIHDSNEFKFTQADSVTIYILSSNPDAFKVNDALSENTRYLQVSSPIDEADSYFSAIKDIVGEKGTLNFLISLFIDREQKGIAGLKRLKDLYPNSFYITVGLFCTAHEYFNKFSEEELLKTKHNPQAVEYNLQKNAIAARMYEYLEIFEKSNLVSNYLVNSQISFDSYEQHPFFKQLAADKKLVLLTSGVDRQIYKPLTEIVKKSMREELKVASFTVAFANRFTQYKGSEIIRELLEDPRLSDISFLFPYYFGKNNISFLTYLQEKKPVNIRNVHFYLDIAKFLAFESEKLNKSVISIVTTTLEGAQALLPENLRALVKSLGGIKLLNTPIFALADVYLRPSLWDSQPVSILEALACKCTPLLSDRVGVPFTLPKELYITYPDIIQIHSKYTQSASIDYVSAIKTVAHEFGTKILALKNGNIKFNGLDEEALEHISSRNMARRYSACLQKLTVEAQ